MKRFYLFGLIVWLFAYAPACETVTQEQSQVLTEKQKKARVALKKSNEAKSLKERLMWLDDAIDLDSSLAEAYYLRGWVFMHQKEYEDAQEDLKQALALHPEHLYAYTWLGRTYTYTGQYDKAIACIDSVIQQDSTYIEAYVFKVEAQYYKILFQDIALDTMTNFAGIEKYYPPANIRNYLYGICDASEGQSLSSALSYARKLDSSYPYTYRLLALLYKHCQKYEEEIKVYEDILGIDSTLIWPYEGRAYVYSMTNEYEKAVADYSKVIEGNPNHPDAYISRANIYMSHLDKLPEALRDYKRALTCFPLLDTDRRLVRHNIDFLKRRLKYSK